ncbi:hypothetical protein FGO68_gene13354 [Halteria grandinella]|uniref:Uncharacterized protein n=1 Tax=Halteria grandinella TaxID=5974 RepID=A0A8J8P2F3_HALGN|nr:hypothetical protein FGO68_gene13354 [Halteria grandinella]
MTQSQPPNATTAPPTIQLQKSGTRSGSAVSTTSSQSTKQKQASSLMVQPAVAPSKLMKTPAFFEANEKKLTYEISEEELKKYSLPEDISEVEKCKLLIGKKGEMKLQAYVFKNHERIFRDNEENQDEIIPVLLKSVEKECEEFQIEAGECFAQMLKTHSKMDPQVSSYLHKPSLLAQVHEMSCKMLKTWSQNILKAWMRVFIRTYRKLQYDSDHKQLLTASFTLAMTLNDKQQPLPTKIVGAFIVGKLSFLFRDPLQSQNSSPSKSPRRGRTLRQGGGSYTIQTYQSWLGRFKQICYDINWEVREQIAMQFARVMQNLGVQKACHDVNSILKEIEDLIEDEEEDVVCSILDSAVKIMQFLLSQMAHDGPMIEKYISPILGKILTLMANKQKIGIGQALSAPKVNDRLMKISGELVHMIACEFMVCFEGHITDALFGTICEFAKEQINLAFTNRENFIKTAETTAISLNEDSSPSDTPKAGPPPIQGPEILKNFVYNAPSYALDLPKEIFASQMLPLIMKLFEYPVQTFQCQFLQTLPAVITASKDDQARTELISKLDETLSKALEDKCLPLLTASLKELHLLYSDYHNSDCDQFFESTACYSHLLKRLQSPKLLALMCSKDWRVYEVYLGHIRNIVEVVEAPGGYFGKSGLMVAMLKTLKKHLSERNRKQIIAIVIACLTKNCSNQLRNDIHNYINIDLASSRAQTERAIFVEFCAEISKHISRRYFAEAFLESYVSLIQQERHLTVLISLIKHLPQEPTEAKAGDSEGNGGRGVPTHN